MSFGGVILNKTINMLSDSIGKTLIKLAYPIILSNFIQTLFGLINMIWIGRLGSGAVSAIGTASFYVNLATAISTIVIIGTGVRVAQTLGANKKKESSEYIRNGLIVAFVLSLLFCIIVGVFSEQFISFYQMNDPQIEGMAITYLRHSLVGIPFMFLGLTLISILTSLGNTKLTFKASSIGLIVNIVLDPLLIFGASIFPAFGVAGAAWGSNIARILTFTILIIFSNNEIKESLRSKMNFKKIFEVIRMSFPVTAQRVIFILISIYMARFIVQYGTQAMAVQKIGVQIESISYVTIGGLQGAISAFVGQNYGAKNYKRIAEGYHTSLKIVVCFGFVISLLFIFFSKEIFSIFISEQEVIKLGASYMSAIGVSQIFMCLELLTVGAFNGMGITYVPPIVSVILTASRIPLAAYMSKSMGLNGIWWSISVTSILKGVILVGWYKFYLNRKLEEDKVSYAEAK